MIQAAFEESYDDLISLSESLINSLHKLDNAELQKEVTEYTGKIERFFIASKSCKPEQGNLEKLKYLIQLHERVSVLFNKEKENLSGKLKNLRVGKTMQSAYSKK